MRWEAAVTGRLAQSSCVGALDLLVMQREDAIQDSVYALRSPMLVAASRPLVENHCEGWSPGLVQQQGEATLSLVTAGAY